jgi:hypothetical protein
MLTYGVQDRSILGVRVRVTSPARTVALTMTKRPLTNVAASVHDRLLKRSRQTGEDFQFLLQRYAAETASLPSRTVRAPRSLRPQGRHAVCALGRIGVQADPRPRFHRLRQQVPDDGLAFDAATIRADPISDEAEYGGLRVRLRAMLGVAL